MAVKKYPKPEQFDFAGYVTRYNQRCTDGLTIQPGAFAHCDGMKVPLVWQHNYAHPKNILGKVYLEHRDDGVYGYGVFNSSETAGDAKLLLEEENIEAMSIHANMLEVNHSIVNYGDLKEVSLVVSGANKQATVDFLTLSHADGTITPLDDEAIIVLGELTHADGDDKETVQDILDGMSDKQRDVVAYLMAKAIEDGEEETEQKEVSQADAEGEYFMSNAFEQNGAVQTTPQTTEISHADFPAFVDKIESMGSLKQAALSHATEYGISNIELLFPDAKTIDAKPEWIKRDTDWVAGVLATARKTPFSRVKIFQADITADEARAKGYVTGNIKKEEVFKLLTREVSPTTVYKKQKFDRDNLLDVGSWLIPWVWTEMRMMYEEEIARAILVGDGREFNDVDKINEDKVMPIYKDSELFTSHVVFTEDVTPETRVDEIIDSFDMYKASGTPSLYITRSNFNKLFLQRDKMGRRLYRTKAELAEELGVYDIIFVPVLEGISRVDEAGNTYNLFGIITNLSHYNIGTDAGGQLTRFDQFDINYNQQHYLMEGRMSGMQVKIKNTLVLEDMIPAPTPASEG